MPHTGRAWRRRRSRRRLRGARYTLTRYVLFLTQIDRLRLDFDVEHVCSVTLSNINVYACLVCGHFFQGRGPKTHAYLHAIDASHHVFMHLDTAQVYILPDNEPVDDPSLADIQYQLRLTFSEAQIAQLESADAPVSRDLRAKPYLPGFVGLNNVNHSGAIGVVVQALAHVTPLRNYFLRGGAPAAARTSSSSEPLASSTPLVRSFGMLLRRLWNPRAFKRQVAPHEFLQAVSHASRGRFAPGTAMDPVEFLGWFLNQLHMDLVGGAAHRKKPSVITSCFQGALRLESQQVQVRTGLEEADDVEDHTLRDARGRAQFDAQQGTWLS